MNEVDVYARVSRILSDQLGIEQSKISEDSKISSDLGADSLDTAEIAMMIKDEFNYDLSDKEISNVSTVKDIVEILLQKMVKS